MQRDRIIRSRHLLLHVVILNTASTSSTPFFEHTDCIFSLSIEVASSIIGGIERFVLLPDLRGKPTHLRLCAVALIMY